MTRLADHLDPCPGVHALAPRLAPHLTTALGIPAASVDRVTAADLDAMWTAE
jgi:hypothetical protein